MSRTRALDQAKAATFIGKHSAFLGCLLCSLQFEWDKSIETACVGNSTFKWNPDWFDTLSPEERSFVILHELWHVALLHGVRRGSKDPERWNSACDYVINDQLISEGYIMPEGGLYNPKYKNKLEEDIYNELPENPPTQSWGSTTLTMDADTVGTVKLAVTAAKIAGYEPGSIEKYLSDFYRPKLPWKQLLRNFLLEKLEREYSWSRPNKRRQDMYLPSYMPTEGRLTSIAMYMDTSGSITDEDIKRFSSEAKFVQESLNPLELRVVQFDTKIQKETVYNDSNPFTSLSVEGFGGTDFSCVHDHIMLHKPTLSIIFTDLYAIPMEKPSNLEVIWIIKDNDNDAPFGRSIHVD